MTSMLQKVLIANRGEIAVRVIRACRDLGIATVAVYSDLDRDSLHVRLADEAYSLGGATAAESYLQVDKIIDAIKTSGADGVHPGYGFLSENADFARSVTDLGVAFIGPQPEAIEIMGDKLSARAAAERVGVNGVPGNTEPVTEVAAVESFAAEYGWPVVIKAAYGGGGRGMKVVRDGDDIAGAIASAQREAMAYFGRDELFLERYLENPRHVEVQLLADVHGTCVYLGTRDCTAQRRHQKLIEEAPAPAIAPETIKAMGEAAVAVAKGCDYVNAGTVEFLYEDGEFYYLEMNTRLQVEHPVSEMVTGVDLVAEQLRVAAGEPLGYTQDEIEIRGHAIEVRINAEDPAGGAFLPAPGLITELRSPDGFGVRFDGGYESGDELSPYYDNLVGKLIVWAPDRDLAIRRCLRALDELVIRGIKTTIPADVAILSDPDFAAVRHSTKWVEARAAEWLANSDDASTGPETQAAGETPREPQNLTVEVNGKRFDVNVYGDFAAAPATASTAPARRRSASRSAQGQASAASGQIVAPMQGTVISAPVGPGESVAAGEVIAVIEAMKMENAIAAPAPGVVKSVSVAVGDTVRAGDVIAVIEPA